MPYKKGESGNPAGRPVGSTNAVTVQRANLNKLLLESGEEIVKVVIETAKAGDLSASKLVLERILPALKSSELKVSGTVNIEADLLARADEKLINRLTYEHCAE